MKPYGLTRDDLDSPRSTGRKTREEGRRDKHGTGDVAAARSQRNGRRNAKRRAFKSRERQGAKREIRESRGQ